MGAGLRRWASIRRGWFHALLAVVALAGSVGLQVQHALPSAATPGTILRTFAPVDDCDLTNRGGVAFDGANLLLSCLGTDVIDTYSPIDGSFIQRSLISGTTYLSALAWDRGRNAVWACDNANANVVVLIDMVSLSATFQFSTPGCYDGLSYDGTDDTLWLSPQSSGTIYHYTAGGVALPSHPANMGPSGNSGIAVGGQYLFLGNDGNSKIYQALKPDLPLPYTLLYASVGVPVADMECDDLTFHGQGKGALWFVNRETRSLTAIELNSGDCGWGGYPATGGPVSLIGGALTAAERRGGCNAAEIRCVIPREADPVDPATGNFSESAIDLSVPNRGGSIEFSRTYNSDAAASNGLFGRGWSSPWDMSLAFSGPGPDTVTVTQENGAVVVFNRDPVTSTYKPAAPRILATLVHGGTTWTLTRRARQRFDFNSTGLLTRAYDTNNNATTISRPSSSTITITDAASRTYTLSLSGGHVTSLSDPATPARTVAFGYDGAGDLIDVRDVGLGHTTYGYDTSSRLTTIRTPRFYGDTTTTPPPVITNHYTAGRVDWQSDPLGRKTNFYYDTPAVGSTKVTDPKGNSTVYRYSSGLPVALTRGKGSTVEATWTFAYDRTTGGVTFVKDPNGHLSATAYDAAGNALRRNDAAGDVAKATYNALDEPLTVTDGHNVSTTMTYDAAGNELDQATPLLDGTGAVIATRRATYHRDDASHRDDVTSLTDPDGKVWSYTYDAVGNQTTVTDPITPTPDVTRSCYDTIGRRTKVIAPKGSAAGITCASATPAAFTTYFTYNAFGDLLTSTDPLVHTQVSRTYDANRNVATSRDANANQTTSTYDAADEPTRVDRADGTNLRNDYWPDGSLKTQYDGAGKATAYAYDAQGRLSTVTDPLLRVTTYGYDPAGNLVTKKDPGGTCVTPKTGCTTYTYDAADRRSSVDYSDPATPDVTAIGYDANSQRISMTDGTGTSSWAWDSLHRMTSSTRGTTTVGYGYNLRGLLTSIAYPGGSCTASPTVSCVTRTYDDAGRLRTVNDGASTPKITTFSHDADSNPTSQVYPNGDTATFTPDGADRLMAITDTKAGVSGSFASFSYGRDNANQLSSVTSTGVPTDTHTYDYTALNQLYHVDAPNYRYDAADNLTLRTDGTVQNFDVANELTTSSRISVVATGQANGAGLSDSVTPSAPPAGDDQVIIATTQAANVGVSVASPSGGAWAVVGDMSTGASATDTRTVVWRQNASGLVAPYTVTYATPTAHSIVLGVYRGVDPGTPIDVAATGGMAIGNAVTAPTLTPTRAGDQLLSIFGATHGGTGHWATPAGMTAQVHDDTAAGTSAASSALADQLLATAAPSGPRTATWTGAGATSAPLVGISVALRPAAQATYGYDNRGNRTTGAAADGIPHDYGYDQANRLVSYQGTGKYAGSYPSATYAYRGDGLRMAKTVTAPGASPVTQDFVWDEAEGLPLLIADGPTKYVTGPGGLPLEQLSTHPAITLMGTTTSSATSGCSVSVTPGGGGTGSSCPVGLPVGIQTGDEILVASTQSTGNNVTIAGQTALGTYSSPGTPGTSITVFAISAQGGETSETLTYSGVGAHSVVVAVYRGVDAAKPVDYIAPAPGTASGTTVTTPTTTAALGGEMAVMFMGATGNSAASTWAPAAPLTLRADNPQAMAQGAVADQLIPGSGTIASKSATFGTTAALAGVLIGLRHPPGVLYYHQDQLGSTRALTDNGGGTYASYTYDAYGNLTGSTGTANNPFGFAGQYTDGESGLTYLRARYYDPTTGQFLTRDPLAAITGSPYGYTAGNPLNGTDPSGMFCLGHLCTQDFRLSDAAHGFANFSAGIGDFVTSTVTLGHVRIHAPYCGPGLGASYAVGQWTGIIEAVLAGRRGPVAPRAASSLVDDTVRMADDWLGPNVRTITNRAGDKVFLSDDGLRRIRFDINNPAPHTSPHAHVEELINGRWVKSGPIFPRDVPQR